MTQNEKQHLKELRRPDALQMRLARFLDEILSHSKLIGAIGLAGAVVVGGYYIYDQIQTSIRKDRVEALSKVQIVYSSEEKAAADKRLAIQKQIQALTPTPEAPKAPKAQEGQIAGTPPTPPPLTPEVEAQKKALTEQMEAIKADHTESRKQFEEFAKKYPSEPEGWAASMTVAKILLDKEQFQEARAVYEALLGQTKSEPFYQIQARLSLIGALEELGEFDKGLAEVDQLINLVGGSKETSTTTQALYAGYSTDLMPKLLLVKAQLLVFKGSKDDAKKTLAQIIDQHGGAPEAQKARNLKSMVN